MTLDEAILDRLDAERRRDLDIELVSLPDVARAREALDGRR